MLRSSVFLSKNCSLPKALRSTRFLGTLVATEEFPHDGELKPVAASPAVLTTSKSANGLSLISRSFNSSSVSIKVAVLGGSSAETMKQKGAAHFLATAAYAGTSTSTGFGMVRKLESMGANFRAFADKEKIVYDFQVLPDDVESALHSVLQLVGSAPYANYVLEEFKPIAQLAYNSFATNYSAQLYELVNEAAYGETSPLGSSLYAPSLSKLTIPSVLDYRARTFVSGNVIVAANGVPHDTLKEIVDAAAGCIPAGTASALRSGFVGGEVKVRTDLGGVTHLGLAFPVPAGEAGKSYAVLRAHLASKFASKNICVQPVLLDYVDGGLLVIHASGAPAQASEYLASAVQELKTVAATAPSNIDILKQKVSLDNFIALEGTDSTTMMLNAHMRGLTPEAYADARNVSAASVSAAAASALQVKPAFAVLGTTAGTPSLATVSNWMK